MKQLFTDRYFQEDLFSELRLFNVGHEACRPNHSQGPTIKEDYILHLVVAGKGFFEENGQRTSLGTGDFFLIKAGAQIFYQADEKEPWTYYWLGFSGEKARLLFQDSETIGRVENNQQLAEMEQLFRQLLAADQSMSVLQRQSTFLALLDRFTFSQQCPAILSEKGRGNLHGELFLTYVRNNYHRQDLSIHEVSQALGLTPAYLSQLIKILYEVSPKRYLQWYRMEKAYRLLVTTDLPVNLIGEMVGYPAAQSFSRAFKQMVGSSPQHIQKNANKN